MSLGENLGCQTGSRTGSSGMNKGVVPKITSIVATKDNPIVYIYFNYQINKITDFFAGMSFSYSGTPIAHSLVALTLTQSRLEYTLAKAPAVGQTVLCEYDATVGDIFGRVYNIPLPDQSISTTIEADPTVGVIKSDNFDTGALQSFWYAPTALVAVKHSSEMFDSGTGGAVAPRSGSYALEVDYRSGDVTSNAEIRFDLGGDNDEVWLKMDIYIPTDYFHIEGSATNHKFFYIWGGSKTDNLSGHLTTGGVSTQLWTSGSVGESKIRPKVITSGLNTYYPPDNRLIRTSDFGTWINVIWRVKQPSASNNDGIIQVWKTTEAGVRTQIANETNGYFYQAAQVGYRYGYLFGSPNSGPYTKMTHYVDNVYFSTASLL